MRLADVAAETGVAVLAGFGVENQAFVAGAAARMPAPAWRRLVVVERSRLGGEVLADLAERFGCPVEQQATLPADAGTIVRSPGFLVPPAVAEAVPTTNAAALWLAERAAGPGRTVGVTGTKGKSSVTTLLADQLARRGTEVFLGGNVGTALWSRPPDDPVLTVAELSSYQAIELHHSPEVAAITTLGEDHLDLHGTVAAYHEAKLHVVCGRARAAEVAVVGEAAVELVQARCADVELRTVAPADDVRVANARVVAALLVVLGAEQAAGPDLVDELVASYPSLPGRFDEVLVDAAGRRWVDDALGSNPAALVAALHRAAAEHADGPLVVIVGGRDDRHATTESVLDAAAALRGRCELAFVGVDAFGSRLGDDLRALGVAFEHLPSLEHAVAAAADRVAGGGTVVFSPGAPTPTDQGSWKDRSRRFAAAAEAVGEGS